MVIIKDTIIVDFDKIECMNIEDVKYCWKCKMYRDKNDFQSLYEDKKINKSCRDCLDEMAKYYLKHKSREKK